MALYLLDNIFLLHLALEAAQSILEGLALLKSYVCQPYTPPDSSRWTEYLLQGFDPKSSESSILQPRKFPVCPAFIHFETIASDHVQTLYIWLPIGSEQVISEKIGSENTALEVLASLLKDSGFRRSTGTPERSRSAILAETIDPVRSAGANRYRAE